jgi:peptidoglycan hydrolase-like protein with peptidoglycan-binding domain
LTDRRRIRIAAAATLTLAGGAVAAIAALGSPGTPASRADVGVPAGEQAATVQRRTLTEHTQASGTLSYAGSQDIYDRVAGTFTWLPSVGAVIGRGGTLWRIDNEPVVLMYGPVPAYRSLRAGVSDGPDVGELNANLAALGFDPTGTIAGSEHFGEATAAAVERWQQAEGLKETGSVQLGRVVFGTSARRVTAVHVALGQDPPGAAETPAPAPATKKPASTSPAKSKRPHHRKHGRASGKAAPHPGGQGSDPPKSESPGKGEGKPGSGSPGSANEGAGAAELVLSTTSTRQVVVLQVKASQQELAHVGESAPVTLPDGTSVEGQITNVGTVATEGSGEGERGGGGGSGNGENATIPVTVTLDRRVPRLDRAPVSVELVKEVRRDVLTVPATALVAVAGGAYAIRVLEGGRRALLSVTPGMFAGGYVQVEGAGVREGLTVLEPQ